MNEQNLLLPMILDELQDHHEIDIGDDGIKRFLEKKYGKPEIVSSSIVAIESVFDIGEKKLGIVEEASSSRVIGFSVYRGDVPAVFAPRQQGACTGGYSRTFPVTTTSPTIKVFFLNPFDTVLALFKTGIFAALATGNLILHAGNVSTAKTTACAPCTLPCTCVSTTVAGAGTAAFAWTLNRVWGIPVGANVAHVITTTVTVSCA